MSDNLITCFCPTYNRPRLLGRAIKCFLRNTYKRKFLIIIDDAGQYENQKGDQWELISIPRRVLSLGEKNNICCALAPRDTFAYQKFDDDDFYYPWTLEAAAEALERSPLVQPRLVMDYFDGRWVVTETRNRHDARDVCYHGSWAFRRSLFVEHGGYRPLFAGDDQEFTRRLYDANVRAAGYDESRFKPSYLYNRPLQNRISSRGDTAEAYFEPQTIEYVGKVPEWTDESDWERPIPTEIIKRRW